MMEQAQRSAVLELQRAGHKEADIVKILKYPSNSPNYNTHDYYKWGRVDEDAY